MERAGEDLAGLSLGLVKETAAIPSTRIRPQRMLHDRQRGIDGHGIQISGAADQGPAAPRTVFLMRAHLEDRPALAAKAIEPAAVGHRSVARGTSPPGLSNPTILKSP